jgi:putative membrane protein
MISNFRDHAANERTFLAWVRTAIAIMAFGFFVEKFDLFIELAAPALADHAIPMAGQSLGNFAGLALVVLGIVMIVLAAGRFIKTTRDLDSTEQRPARGTSADLALAGLLALLGCALFVYLSHRLFTGL